MKKDKDAQVVYTPPVLRDNSANPKSYDIKAVIFDLGNVLIEWPNNSPIYNYIADRFGLEFEDARKRIKALVEHVKIGKMSEKEFWTKFFNSYKKPLPKDWKDLWQKKFRECSKLNEEAMSVVKKLKANRYKLVTITNTVPSHYDWVEKMGWHDPFDIVIASCKVGVAKPDLGIFKLALKELGLKGSDCVFIDNMEEHVEAANHLGIRTILYKADEHKIERLVEGLRGYGVRC